MKSILILSLAALNIACNCHAAGNADLIRLYEEEILAHDLYVTLGKTHTDIMPLKNIPRSEKMHRDALAAILKSEGIKVPKPPKGRRFVSDGLDQLFKQWRAEGMKSEAAACRVGVRLEDHDIADLRQAQIDFPKHKEVLAQLEAASNNHLRAFHRNLTSRGGSYKVEALPAADLKKILNSDNDCGPCERACGPGNGEGRGQGNGNGNGNGKCWRGGR